MRHIWLNLDSHEKSDFLGLSGIHMQMMRKYTRPSPEDRPKPTQDRFDAILNAMNTVRPGCITREQLAAYFYESDARGHVSAPLHSSDAA